MSVRSTFPRDFWLYLASWSLENVGAQMLGVAVGWQVYALRHRPLDLGYVGLAQLVPELGLSLLAGQVADRLPRERVAGAMNLALGGCAFALLVLTTRGVTAAPPIYAVLCVVGAARAFAGPASQALLPGLVDASVLAKAITWSSTAWQLATIVGPAFGGLLYGAARGAAPVYATSAGLLAAAAVFAFAIRPNEHPASDEPPTWATVFAGFRYVGAHRVILESISLDLFAVLLGGATALLPVFANDILHVGPSGLGALGSAPAIGAAAMAMWLGLRPIERMAGRRLLVAVGVFGAMTVAFGLSRSFVLSLVCLAVLGAADMISVVIRSTVVQLETPHAMRGRVSAVSMMFIIGSSQLGALESGVTAAWLGTVPAVVAGGIGTLVVVAMYAAFSKLRSIDRLAGNDG